MKELTVDQNLNFSISEMQ